MDEPIEQMTALSYVTQMKMIDFYVFRNHFMTWNSCITCKYVFLKYNNHVDKMILYESCTETNPEVSISFN